MSYDTAPSNTPVPPGSLPEQPILAEFAEPTRQRGWGPWAAALVVCLVFGGGCVALAVWLVPEELKRWRLASAEEQRLNGDLQGALQQLNEDIQRSPRDIELRRRKSQWLLEDKQYQAALDEVNQIISWRPTDVEAYVQRTMIYQAMGRHEQAVADWKQIIGFDAVSTGGGRAQALNGLAYARSLANMEIDEGLADIEEAMRLHGENYAMLDTRGFLYYRKADLDRALQDLDNAVSFAEAEYAALAGASPPLADRRLKKEADLKGAQSLAVIRYHRALIHEARKDAEKAELDRSRVRELGFEPDDTLF